MNQDWWLDELAHAGAEHLDADYVAAYDRKAATDPSDDVEALRALGLGPRSIVVDLAAGTGTFAAAVAPHCGRVIAVDVSPAMVDVLRARGNLDVVHAGFLTYEHTGAPAAFVYVRNALHQLPDFWKAIALQRIAGILEPGGILRLRDLAYSCETSEAGAVIDAWCAAGAGRSEDGWTRAEREEHVRDEFSTFTWLLEPMFEHAGFEIVEGAYSRDRIYARYTCRLRTS